MKPKPITIIEFILVFLFVATQFLKYAHVPFMGMIFSLSAGILSMIYFAGGLSLTSSSTPTGNSFAFGFAFGLTILALLFKFQRWPFGGFYLILSISALLLLAVVKLIAILAKKPLILPFEKGIIIRYTLFILLLVYAFLS